ncbi:MAG: OmpA family protein [Deltaproteobacteria bacterium]|nr:OmpA family protein [Deltaproteobacteria bacterium]
MRPARLLASAFSCSILFLAASAANAQEQKGFNLDRFEPSERGSDWFALESLDLRGHVRPAFGVVGDYGYKPLVLYDLNDNERAAIVRHSMIAHIGGSLVLWDRLRLGVSYPLAITQSGDNSTATINGVNSTYKAPSGTASGDLRLGVDLRLLGTYGGPFTAAFGAQLWAPTGSRDNYMSDGKVRVQPRFTAAGDIGAFAYAGKLGVNIRPQTDKVADSPMGSEIAFAASAGIRAVDKKLLIGPEIFGSTVFTESDAFLKKRTTPFEVLFGAHYQPAADWRIGAGVGPGLTRGFGSPELRVVASIEFFPAVKEPAPPPPADRDHDGIIDLEDACPDVAGVKTADPKTNGCPPPPPDRDKDGVLDPDDACPDTPGVPTQDPKTNGCPPPPPDRDNDGIIDAEDACPDTPGIKDPDPKKNGCPPPSDRDKDGIIDGEDACPDQPGPRDPDPKKNGCPAARIEQGQIKIIQQVKFETGKATILPVSDAILTSVAQILTDHPEVKLVSVEGHTDNKGNPAANKILSNQRAAAVVAWLVKHNIDKKRLTSAGFGQEKPIDTNDTDEGRQNNRRVEFHIRDNGDGNTVTTPPGKTAPPPAGKTAPPPAGKGKAAPPPPPPAGKGKTAPPPVKGKK